MKTIQNEFVSVSYYEDNGNGMREYIFFRDKTDSNNDPSGFTKKVRDIKLAWKFLEQIFADDRLKNDLRFSDVLKILDDKFNLNTHIYCAVD